MKIIKRIAKNSGDAYISTLINIFIITMFMFMMIIILPVFIQKYHLDMYASQLSDFIAVSGGTENINPEQIAEEMGLNIESYEIDVADSAVYEENSTEGYVRIQLTGAYTVTVKTTAYIGLGGIVDGIPIELTSIAKGRSEVFWKDMEEYSPGG